MPDPESRFSDRVASYRSYRPGYPPEVFAFIRETCAPDPSWSIADIGSGTGIATQALLDAFTCTVHAVEPNALMRGAAETTLGNRPGFHSVDSNAAATGLPTGSVDLVTAFQAFHWFDPEPTRTEWHRILRDSGWILLCWNERLTTGSPFLEGYEAILRELPEYAQLNHRNVDRERIRTFLGPGEMHTASFPHFQDFDLTGLLGRFHSSSYTPPAGSAEQIRLSTRLEELFTRTHARGWVYPLPLPDGCIPGRL